MHEDWDKLLKAFVVPSSDGINRIRYRSFKQQGHAALKRYLDSLQAVVPARLDRAGQFAFWANLYNAKTIDIVLERYPVKSIKDINLGGGLLTIVTGGPWKAKVLRVDRRELSLDDIEHGIMRPQFRDPRVHYSVNCASIGCPNLMTEAFTAPRLEAMLEAGARAFVNHPRGVSVAGGKASASQIYSWFQADFGGNEVGVLAHLKRYAAPDLKRQLDQLKGIDRYAYDWNLNDVA